MSLRLDKLPKIGKTESVGKLEESRIGLDKVSTSSTGNISIKQYLYVKDSLPKSSLSRTILYDNVIEDRHLQLSLTSLSLRRNRTNLYCDINKRAFQNEQKKKHEQWRDRHERLLTEYNLPAVHSPKSSSTDVFPALQLSHTILTGPETPLTHQKRTILPLLKARGACTTLEKSKDESLKNDHERPTLKHNVYTDRSILKSWPSDPRFKGLHLSLQKAILKKWDQYPIENMRIKSRAAKFKERLAGGLSNRRKSPRKVLIASRNSLRSN